LQLEQAILMCWLVIGITLAWLAVEGVGDAGFARLFCAGSNMGGYSW